MTKISSKYTVFHKKGFPLLCFEFLAFFIVTSFTSGAAASDPMFLVLPCAVVVFCYFLMKKLVWDLVDEVFDCGDYLLVRNQGAEERVPLTNIMNVSSTMMMNPPRITLRLVKAGKFGEEISFSPVLGFNLNPFAKSKLADELILRVDRARVKRAV